MSSSFGRSESSPVSRHRNETGESSSPPEVEAEQVTFHYPGFEDPALDDLSFKLEQGNVLGIVGHLGAGKSTLCMGLAGFAPRLTGGQLTGELTVTGKDPRSTSGDEMTDDVGMVFENFSAQITQVHPLEEVSAPLINHGTPLTQAEEQARKLLKRVNLGHLLGQKKRTWELSGGQQQRMAIAAMLAREPELLIFDDATGMLDPAGTESIKDIIRELAGDRTLIIVDQCDLLADVADRVLVMNEGKILRKGPTDDILRDTETLLEAGVEPPMPARIGSKLELPTIPLTGSELSSSFPINNTSTMSINGTSSKPEKNTLNGSRDKDSLLEAKDVTYTYGDGTKALENFNLNVKEGTIVGIAGGNGAGKTTLMKLFSGLIEPSSGSVLVNGTDTREATAAELAESLGTVFQNPDEQISEGTVRDELRFPLKQRQFESDGWFSSTERYGEEFIEKRVNRALDLVNLPDSLLERDPSFLPRGQRKLVTLAEVLTLDPSVVLLDEPVVGMDYEARQKIGNVIQNLQDNGKSVLVVEHDMDFLSEQTQSIAVLKNGSLRDHRPPRDLFAQINWDRLKENELRPPIAARLSTNFGLESVCESRLLETLKEGIRQ